MKKIALAGLVWFVSMPVFAQIITADSLAYQLQRAKINHMLDERRDKFGQYDQSLSKHTGIFGLQTKKDIRRSNDILMDIAGTDDSLFRQIKILLDYRLFQQQQVQTKSVQVESNSLGYMNTINRLRAEVNRLNQEAQKEKEHQEKLTRNAMILFVLMLGSILFLLIKKRTVKA
jgi:hypothetical protein